MVQNTVDRSYVFEGKGLHTGAKSTMTIHPAEVGTGIIFRRSDLGGNALVKAIASRVTSTARCTTLSGVGFEIHTVEHVMSALCGLGIDNALVEVDNIEVPILDGSARFYVEAMKGGVKPQQAKKKILNIEKTIEVKDEKSGSWVRVTPAAAPSFDITVDFGSRVLGVQSAHWDLSMDYSTEIAPCRTFVFFHEIEFLFKNNLIKGGDVDNAIVIVEHPVTEESLDALSALVNRPKLAVTPGGYLDNVELHFPNECGRHKLLDLIGDMRLVGGLLNAHVEAFKPGHTINSLAAMAVLEALK